MKLKVQSIEVVALENAGCNNGNYPGYTLVCENGWETSGITCRCQNGCSGTDMLPAIGAEFEGEEVLYRYFSGDLV